MEVLEKELTNGSTGQILLSPLLRCVAKLPPEKFTR